MADLIAVTGAAGALGRAVLDELTGAGRTVVALDLPGEPLDEVGAREGVHAVEADLADRAAVTEAWKRVDEVGAPIGLVTLAGGFRPGSLAELDEDSLEGLWRANVASMLWSAQQAAPRMEAAGGGSIVTVGSRTALGGPAPIAHASTKAAVVRATDLLADELRGSKVRVNSVLPSVIDTPANRTWMSEDLAARAVSSSAIAKVVGFLLSPDAWLVSGARIPVYGDA
jgi:NAD(P)-dependent dehydrogenase (short-subunit alcohol dehydrogenase family)